MLSAEVADILRSVQRDNLFINSIEDDLQSFYKVLGPKNYQLRQTAPTVATGWYYLMTSLSNCQTLGEEYTGTIRMTTSNKLPGKMLHCIWLILYIGGEPLLDRLTNKLKNTLSNSSGLTEDARFILTNIIDFVASNKMKFKRMHQALFYINGKYYNVSNRLTGLKYALVRPWLKDTTFSGSFQCLGYLSLFYTLFTLVYDMIASHSSHKNSTSTNYVASAKLCPLCTDNLKAASSTPCGHIFCWSCIYDSLRFQKNCPICREEISPSRIFYLQNYV